MHRRSRSSSHADRNPHAVLLKQSAQVLHLLQRRRNQSAHAHETRIQFACLLQYQFVGYHHAQIVHLEVVARQHDAHDILSNVVHITVGSSQHHDIAFCLRSFATSFCKRFSHTHVLPFQLRFQHLHRLAHHLRRLHHLRQKHLTFAEEPAHMFHRLHQRLLNHRHRVVAVGMQRLHDVFPKIAAVALAQCVLQSFLNAALSPVSHPRVAGRRPFLLLQFQLVGKRYQRLRSLRRSVQDDILHRPEQVRFYVVVNLQHRRVDDAHIQSGAYGMIEESRVHRLPHRVVTSEGKREVAHAAARLRQRQVFFNPGYRPYEVDAVGSMLLDARTHRQDVHVEDDVLRRKPYARQQSVCPFCNSNLALVGCRLSLLVERHHHHSSPESSQFPCLSQKLLLAALQADAVHDALTLCVLQSLQNRRPVRRVDHEHRRSDSRFVGDIPHEVAHLLAAVQHGVVHVDVDDFRTALNLLSRHLCRLLVFLFRNESCKLARTRHVGALAYVRERWFYPNPYHLQTSHTHSLVGFGGYMRFHAPHRLRYRPDVSVIRSAASSCDIQETRLRHLPQMRSGEIGQFLIFTHLVGQTGVGMYADESRQRLRQLFDKRSQLRYAERAVQSEGEDRVVGNAHIERLQSLSRQRSAASVVDGSRHHHLNPLISRL